MKHLLAIAAAAVMGMAASASADCPAGSRRVQATVRKGENLAMVAGRLGVAATDLARWNRLREDRLRPGRTLFWCQTRERPGSIGSCGHGRLAGGVSLDRDGDLRGVGFVIGEGRTRLYGTPQTVSTISACMRAYRHAYPRGAPFNIGDISARTGGSAPPHVSHQSGRDVDIGFMLKPPQSPGAFDREATPANLDVEKQWFLVKCFLDARATEGIFMEWPVVKTLKAYVDKRPKLRHYARFFPASTPNVIKADSDHRTHMHVRFHCPRGDSKCVD